MSNLPLASSDSNPNIADHYGSKNICVTRRLQVNNDQWHVLLTNVNARYPKLQYGMKSFAALGFSWSNRENKNKRLGIYVILLNKK
jgi:hypothetical protein